MKTGREERTSDFRRRASVEMGGSYIRRALWRSVARSLKSEVTNRGSGTLAASALARHCEATGVSLPRKGRVHESVRGQSPSNSSGLQWLLWQGLITERAAMARRLREPVRVGIGLYRPG